MFIKGPAPLSTDPENAFRREIFKLPKQEGKQHRGEYQGPPEAQLCVTPCPEQVATKDKLFNHGSQKYDHQKKTQMPAPGHGRHHIPRLYIKDYADQHADDHVTANNQQPKPDNRPRHRFYRQGFPPGLLLEMGAPDDQWKNNYRLNEKQPEKPGGRKYECFEGLIQRLVIGNPFGAVIPR